MGSCNIIFEVVIIKTMQPRDEKVTTRVTAHEKKIFQALAEHLGTDVSSAMRQSTLQRAREEGISVPEAKKKG